MSAVGHLAGHIAHELNNPLTGIRTLAQVILEEGNAGDQVLSDMREVEKARKAPLLLKTC
ncbi:MAG: histidine kinase dimerization/phospho-acceptor domain-containing protein [Bdellovibrionales bacterium]